MEGRGGGGMGEGGMGCSLPLLNSDVILQLSWHGWCPVVRTRPSGDTGLGWEAGGGGVCGPAS